MTRTLAFDVYGTLIDPMSMAGPLTQMAGSQADTLARLWRETQLAFSFRRAAMRSYVPFSQVTAEALDHACAALGIEATEAKKRNLLALYRSLPAFPDAEAALRSLAAQGHALHPFSNGTEADISALMQSSGLAKHLSRAVSVEAVQSFKPDPRVYTFFETKAGARAANTWLISSNPFDIIGAGACGWRTIWVRRDPSISFDPWGKPPTHIVTDLSEIATLLEPATCV